jgi:glycosyltransferase involved in cell wall biosynthesis
MPDPRPIRILHVVYYMHRGGTETWLMHVLRHLDREQFPMDFLVHTRQPCAYDEEIRSLGGKIIPAGSPVNPWAYPRRFLAVLREHGPYDVVHSHVSFHGYVLGQARRAGVPVRIAHSHNDAAEFRPQGRWLQRLFLAWTNPRLRRDATHGLACSRKAAAALFGPDWQSDPRWRLHHYGIDLRPFQTPVDPAGLRKELGIPTGALVVGHVGRFHPQKNHRFLLDIFAAVARRAPEARLLLVGDGPLRPAIARKAARLGLAGQVIFAGVRADVPDLMRGVIDVLLLPSLYEGLPVVGIEAHAVGLPCVVSAVITDEMHILPGLVRRLPLSGPPAAWAEAALACRARLAPEEALKRLQGGPFDIRTRIAELAAIYRDSVAQAAAQG